MSALADAREALHAATCIYTADPVVSALIMHFSWPANGGKLVEPSCGDGAFLLPALDRLLAHEPTIPHERIPDRLEGWEVAPAAAAEARVRVEERLAAAGYSRAHAAWTAARVVRTGDFLTEGPRGAYCASIAGNPPYLRWAKVPGPLQVEYRTVLPRHAMADLLHAFLDRCASLLQPGGELAFVTSDRWLTNETAGKLRETIGRRFGIVHLEELDAATSFRRPKKRVKDAPPRIDPRAVVLREGEGRPMGRARVLTREPPPVPPGTPRLADVARVRLAPWLGPDGIFVVTSEQARGLPRSVLVPIVDTPEIRGGRVGALTRYAIRTTKDPPPVEVIAHLEREWHRMPERGQRRGEAAWWLPPEPFHRWRLDEESILLPRAQKSLHPIRLPAGVLPVNHSLTVLQGSAWTLDRIERALTSRTAREWIACTMDDIDNEYLSITTRRLRDLPMIEDAP